MTKSWLLFHPDFICGIIVQHHNEHLMAKVTVTLTFDQSLRSRSNVLKNSIWQYLGCYLKHRLYTWYQSTTTQGASKTQGTLTLTGQGSNFITFVFISFCDSFGCCPHVFDVRFWFEVNKFDEKQITLVPELNLSTGRCTWPSSTSYSINSRVKK